MLGLGSMFLGVWRYGTTDGGGGDPPAPMSIFMDFNALGVVPSPGELPVAGPFEKDGATVSGVYAYHPLQADEFIDIIPALSTTGYVCNRGRYPQTIQVITVALDTPLTSIGRYIEYIEFKHASYGTTTLRVYNAGGLVLTVEMTAGSIVAPYNTTRLPSGVAVFTQAQAIIRVEMTTPDALTAIDDLFIQLTEGDETPLPLDSISSAAAYSVRKLRTAYSGSAIRVRRSSDNEEREIGFTPAGDLDTAALMDHCGSGSGFVTTWYDQSGNVRNAVQTNPANQPRIVNAGAVDVAGGLPAIVCVDTSDHLAAASWGLVPQPWSRNAVIQVANPLVSGGHVINSSALTNATEYTQGPGTLIMFAGLVGPTCPAVAGERLIYTSEYNGALSRLVKNGGPSLVGNAGTGGAGGISIGSRLTSSGSRTTFQEVILFASILSDADRQTLEANQGAYYGITVA
jgi:Alpha-L-arabinofuranosidase B, catalytic